MPPAAPTTPPASQPHHVLIVGAGSIGERHLRCFLTTERARVSFVEPRADLRADIATRYPGAHPFDSLESALELRPTAAVVATPAPLHIPQATQLVERGAHVLIEKPLSTSFDGIDALASAAQSKRVQVAVAYVYRAHPILADMRSALLSGKYGKPVQFTAVCGQHFPLYRPAYRQTYYTKRASGGGAVQDALTHILNAGEWLLGSTERLVADLDHKVLEGVDVEDTVHVLARHPEGVMASYSLNQHQAPNENTITIVCQRGTLRFEGHLNRWREMQTPGGEWTDHPFPPLERDTLFTRQAATFLDVIEGKSPPACDLTQGVSTLRANLAILKSAEQRAWVTVQG